MKEILMVLINTPVWVYIVFAVIVCISVRTSRTRAVSLRVIAAVPVLFLAFSVRSIYGLTAVCSSSSEYWFLGIISGSALGVMYVWMSDIRINREIGIIMIPGSKISAVMMFVIFGCRYAAGFIQERHHTMIFSGSYVLIISIIMGLCTGFLAGKAVMYIYRYKTDKSEDVSSKKIFIKENSMKVIAKLVLLAAVAVCFSGTSGYSGPAKGRLKITVINVANNNGTVNVALFNSSGEYAAKEGKPVLKVKSAIHNNRAEISFDDIPFGEYAIKAYHDENSNGIMDKNFMGIPKENYAFSNNAQGTFGSPSYDKVKFTFNKNDVTLEIKMTSAE